MIKIAKYEDDNIKAVVLYNKKQRLIMTKKYRDEKPYIELIAKNTILFECLEINTRDRELFQVFNDLYNEVLDNYIVNLKQKRVLIQKN